VKVKICTWHSHLKPLSIDAQMVDLNDKVSYEKIFLCKQHTWCLHAWNLVFENVLMIWMLIDNLAAGNMFHKYARLEIFETHN